MFIEELRSIFSTWKVQDLYGRGIHFREIYASEFDPNDDYKVVYEALFEPEALDRARVEFWLTDLGYVAVGIETYERIIRRLGISAIRKGFVGGHEPRIVPKDGLKMLFDAVTSGNIFIEVKEIFKLATSSRISMIASDCDTIARSGYRCSDWISPISNDETAVRSPFSLEKVLDYRPW